MRKNVRAIVLEYILYIYLNIYHVYHILNISAAACFHSSYVGSWTETGHCRIPFYHHSDLVTQWLPQCIANFPILSQHEYIRITLRIRYIRDHPNKRIRGIRLGGCTHFLA